MGRYTDFTCHIAWNDKFKIKKLRVREKMLMSQPELICEIVGGKAFLQWNVQEFF